MHKIEYSKNWQSYFRDFGIQKFEDFFDYSEGKFVNRNKKRNVISFSLGGGKDKREFFMKRYFSPHFKDMLFTFSNFGYVCSQARCEWNNANMLLDNGFGTYVPVCYGQDLRFGIERRSFFVTEKLAGKCFIDFLNHDWGMFSDVQKSNMMSDIGRFVRKIHDKGISLPDLFTWHIYLSKKRQGDYAYSIIDLHRMKINGSNSNDYSRNLAAFYFSMIEKFFDDKLKETFLRSYLGGDQAGYDKLYSRVMRRFSVLSSRKKKPAY